MDLEAALDQFEARWLGTPSPPDVLEFVQSFPDIFSTPLEVRQPFWLDLATIDMEMRYRHKDISLHRSCTWYAEHLAKHGMSGSDIEDLALQEMLIRSHWVDRPRIASLVLEQFPDRSSDFHTQHARRLLELIESEFPAVAVLKFDPDTTSTEPNTAARNQREEVHLRTPCEAGRQMSKEKPPVHLSMQSEQDLHRLVVVERRLDSVSRKQVMLQRLSVDRIQVTPLSTKIATMVDGIKLAPEESAEFPLHYLGIQIGFGPVSMAVRLV